MALVGHCPCLNMWNHKTFRAWRWTLVLFIEFIRRALEADSWPLHKRRDKLAISPWASQKLECERTPAVYKSSSSFSVQCQKRRCFWGLLAACNLIKKSSVSPPKEGFVRYGAAENRVCCPVERQRWMSMAFDFGASCFCGFYEQLELDGNGWPEAGRPSQY